MLRESSIKTGRQVNLQEVIQTQASLAPEHAEHEVATEVPSGVEHGAALLRFVDALVLHPEDLEAARNSVMAVLSPEAFVDTCATVASFNAVVKVADGTGIPLEAAKHEKTADLRSELNIDQLRDHGRFEMP